MNGLDAWIEGDNVCTYCGMYSCVCERETDEEEVKECPTCGYTAKEWRGEAACNDAFHAQAAPGASQ